MKNKVVASNLVASLFLQIVTIISGFIIPKIILTYFGSEVNGLVSSISQFLSYITILEGGVGSVIMAALYKPLLEKDEDKINGIVKATQAFFRKISLFYIVYVVAVSLIYPIFIKTDYSYLYVACLTVVLAINLFVQYFFSISYRLLLNADRKVYFVNYLQGITVLFNLIAVVVCAWIFEDILVIKLVSAAVFCIIPVVYSKYVNKTYNLDKSAKPDEKTLSQRWDGFGINLAFFIHSNTDIVVLTVFSTLQNVSVYAIYLMIVKALKGLTISMSNAITPSFGKVLASGDRENANTLFDIYQLGMLIVTTIMFSCGIVLVTPFIDIYTKGIEDANYHQFTFGVVLMLAEMIYCYRDPLIAVSYASGNFKAVSKYAYYEATINIVISLILVQQMGLLGIAIGTATAMFYRMIMQALFASKNVLYRQLSKFIKECFIYGITTIIICFVSYKLVIMPCSTYLEWIVEAFKVFVFATAMTMISSCFFYKEQMQMLLKKVAGVVN